MTGWARDARWDEAVRRVRGGVPSRRNGQAADGRINGQIRRNGAGAGNALAGALTVKTPAGAHIALLRGFGTL